MIICLASCIFWICFLVRFCVWVGVFVMRLADWFIDWRFCFCLIIVWTIILFDLILVLFFHSLLIFSLIALFSPCFFFLLDLALVLLCFSFVFWFVLTRFLVFCAFFFLLFLYLWGHFRFSFHFMGTFFSFMGPLCFFFLHIGNVDGTGTKKRVGSGEPPNDVGSPFAHSKNWFVYFVLFLYFVLFELCTWEGEKEREEKSSKQTYQNVWDLVSLQMMLATFLRTLKLVCVLCFFVLCTFVHFLWKFCIWEREKREVNRHFKKCVGNRANLQNDVWLTFCTL